MSEDGARDGDSGGLNRRDVLKRGALTTFATTVTLSGSAAAETVYLDEEGLSDGDLIDPYLEDYFVSGNTVYVPPGDYEYQGSGLEGGYSNAALIGDGAADDVQLHHPDGQNRYDAIWAESGTVRLENLTFRGVQGGEEGKLRAEARDPDATMVLERVWQPDGVYASEDAVGFYVGAEHAGTVRFVDCYAEDFNDNGLYASAPGNPDDPDSAGGRVVVEGGLYKNNNITGVRLGSTDSYASQVTIVNDALAPANDGVNNQRGFWIRQGGDDVTIEDCDVYHGVDDWRPFEFDNDAAGGSGEIRNSRFYTESSDAVVEYTDADYTADGIHLTGSGDHSVGVPATNVCDSQDGDDCTTAHKQPRTRIWTYEGRGGAEEVSEDFSHGDVSGTYALDAGSFTTTTARATSDSYSLTADADTDDNRIVLREDMETTAGNTYELDIYHQSTGGADVGFVFGAQSGITGWSDYTGYMGFFESDDDEIRLTRKADGSTAASTSTQTSWPLDEWLTVELDYRDTDSSTVTMTVSDAADAEVASLSLADTTHDGGAIGFYNWHATSDWYVDSWFAAGDDGRTVVEDFERSDPLAAYGGATSLYSTTSASYEGSQALVNDGGAYGSLVSTTGLDAYPDRGDEVHYYFDNAAADNFVAVHLFAQSETDVPDGYSVGISGAGAWRMWRTDSGDNTVIASQDLPASEQIDGWYRAEVRSDSSTVYADLYDDSTDDLLASIQADDTTYSSGGMGFRSAGNGEVWDYLVL